MKILVLGGTEFLGKHFVELAKIDHEVILFNRGKSNPNIHNELKCIKGDRYKDIERINDSNFDAVVDTSGYFPKNLEYITGNLKNKCRTYLFVSSCSVFDMYDQPQDNITESGKLVDLNIDSETDKPETYGARKFLCEEMVRRNFEDNHFIVRPGLIVGPDDPTYRFPYWADRVSEGGIVLAPGESSAPLQFIDVRDLAAWMLIGLEKSLTGTFNTVSPYNELTLGPFLESVKKVINPDIKYEWVSEEFLRKKEIGCWSTLPLWVYKEIQAFFKVDSAKAIKAGLKFRPIEETIKDTHLWSKDIYKDLYLHKVLDREHERALLAESCQSS